VPYYVCKFTTEVLRGLFSGYAAEALPAVEVDWWCSSGVAGAMALSRGAPVHDPRHLQGAVLSPRPRLPASHYRPPLRGRELLKTIGAELQGILAQDASAHFILEYLDEYTSPSVYMNQRR
jgi:hypothetical protein